jgi:hypothetical protein
LIYFWFLKLVFLNFGHLFKKSIVACPQRLPKLPESTQRKQLQYPIRAHCSIVTVHATILRVTLRALYRLDACCYTYYTHVWEMISAFFLHFRLVLFYYRGLLLASTNITIFTRELRAYGSNHLDLVVATTSCCNDN